nr:phage tail protein [Loktanella sp. M215]
MDAGIWSAHADLSDTEIVRRAGGTRPLYRLWGTYSLTEEPKSVLARMLTTCNATVYQTAEGKVGIMGGVYAAPDVTITADDIFRFVLIDGTEKLDAFNVVKGIYTSADHDYQDTEAQPWEDITALLTEPERSIQFDADMVPDHGQMRQLMKLELYRQNRPFSLSITTNLVGIKARFPRGTSYHVIRVQNPDMDFDEVCEVVSHKTYAEADGNGVLQWRCQIELVGIDPAWNAWDAITEEGDAPIAPAVLETEGIPVPVISELAQFAAGAGQGVRVTVADISRPDLVFAAQIRLAPSGSWSAMVATDFEAESVGRTIGNTYDVRVKYNGGAYSDPASIEILDPEAP